MNKVKWNLQVIYETFLREFKIFLRYPYWLFVSIVSPFLWVTLFVLFSRAFVSSGDIVGFITIGMVGLELAGVALWGVGLGLRREQMRGTLISLYTTPASRLSIMIGISLENLVEFLFGALIIVGYATFAFGLTTRVRDPFAVLLTFILSYLALFAMGLVMASITMVIKEPNALINLTQPILFIFSGVFFPISVLPYEVRIVAYGIPLTYAIGGMRKSLLMGYTFYDLLPDFFALSVFTVVLSLLGVMLLKYIEKRALVKGSLSKF